MKIMTSWYDLCNLGTDKERLVELKLEIQSQNLPFQTGWPNVRPYPIFPGPVRNFVGHNFFRKIHSIAQVILVTYKLTQVRYLYLYKEFSVSR